MDQDFAIADDFLHHGNMARMHMTGAGKGHNGARFRGVATGIKARRIMPPIATIAPDCHTGCLTHIGHARDTARGDAQGNPSRLFR
jgi:hypothetical protein